MTIDEIKAETKKQFSLLRQGDPDAKAKIVELNIKLVYDVANKLSNLTKKFNFIDLDDLIQTASLAMLKAIDTFDETKKGSFPTYAVTCMRNEILALNKKLSSCYEETILNSPVSQDNEEELVDLLCGGKSPEEVLFCEDKAIFASLVQALPKCEQKFLTMKFIDLAPPELIAKKFKILPEDVDVVMDSIFSSIKKRLNGKPGYSVLFKRELFFENIASFQSDFYDPLPPKTKLFFDQTVLKSPLSTLLQFKSNHNLTYDQAHRIQKGIDSRLETFYLKNILLISKTTKEVLQKFLQETMPDETSQKEFEKILSKKEKQMFDQITHSENSQTKYDDNKIRKAILKKMIIYEKINKNDLKTQKNVII